MNIVKKIPMYNCKKKYTSMIYKNCVYNFLFKNTIDMYNCDLKYKCKKELCNNYRFITEAKKTNEFYAIKENDNKTVYIIDKQFREIDKIILKLSDKYNQEIKGITFNRDECKILISLKNIIYSITPRGDFIKEEINKSTLLQISTSVLKQNTIRNLEGCCQKRNANILTPLITSIGFVCEQVYFSYNKDGSSYLGLLCPNGNMVQNFYIDDDIEINSIVEVNNTLQLLITKKDDYNYLYKTDLSCNKPICNHECCQGCNFSEENECKCLNSKKNCPYNYLI